MLQSFKSLELSLYRISNSLESKIKYYSEKSDKNSIQLASTMFSTSFSLITTYVLNNLINMKSVKYSIAAIIGIYILGYGLSYIVFKKIIEYFRNYEKSKQKYELNKRDDAQNDIDNFDFITCDNILIVYDLINQYLVSSNTELKTFYYYEILYFHSNSIKYIDKVLKNDQYCINVKGRTDAIELFRIINLIKMLEDTQTFLEENVKKLI